MVFDRYFEIYGDSCTIFILYSTSVNIRPEFVKDSILKKDIIVFLINKKQRIEGVQRVIDNLYIKYLFCMLYKIQNEARANAFSCSIYN